jgi:hypothetical protein
MPSRCPFRPNHNDPALAARGIELRERMHRVGFRLSTAQVAIGEIRP